MAIRYIAPQQRPVASDAREILRQRYARGEIDDEEYVRASAALR